MRNISFIILIFILTGCGGKYVNELAYRGTNDTKWKTDELWSSTQCNDKKITYHALTLDTTITSEAILGIPILLSGKRVKQYDENLPFSTYFIYDKGLFSCSEKDMQISIDGVSWEYPNKAERFIDSYTTIDKCTYEFSSKYNQSKMVTIKVHFFISLLLR